MPHVKQSKGNSILFVFLLPFKCYEVINWAISSGLLWRTWQFAIFSLELDEAAFSGHSMAPTMALCPSHLCISTSPPLPRAGASIGGDATTAPTQFTMESSLYVLPNLLIMLLLPSMPPWLRICALLEISCHWIFKISFLFQERAPQNHTDPQITKSLNFSLFVRLSFLCAIFFPPKMFVNMDNVDWWTNTALGVMVKGQYWHSILLLRWAYLCTSGKKI